MVPHKRIVSIDATSDNWIYAALGHPDRRRLIYVIDATTLGTEATWPVDDLLDRVGLDRDAKLLCVHVHLPKLAANDVIVWDRDAGTIRPGPRFAPTVRLLHRLGAVSKLSDPSPRKPHR